MMPKLQIIFVLIFTITVLNVDSFEQKCKTSKGCWMYKNAFDGQKQEKVNCCTLSNHNISNENDITTTSIDESNKVNDVVLFIYVVKFIPNSIFATLPNIECLWIYPDQNFITLKAEFLKNAKKMTLFIIEGNDMTQLVANIFIEAPNLKHINFKDNKIENIHRLAFNGLAQLQGVYLSGNKVKNLSPKTFSELTALRTLNLLGAENCLDKKFEDSNNQVSLVEGDISKNCAYVLHPDDLDIIEQKYQFKMEELQKTNEDLTEKINILEKSELSRIENFNAKFENLQELMNNIQKEANDSNEVKAKTDKTVKDLENQLKIANAKIQALEETSEKAKQLPKMIDEMNVTISKNSVDIAQNSITCKIPETEFNVKITEMAQQISRNADVSKMNYLESEKKSSDNFAIAIKLLQDQKSLIDIDLSAQLRYCGEKVLILEQRLTKVEKNCLKSDLGLNL